MSDTHSDERSEERSCIDSVVGSHFPMEFRWKTEDPHRDNTETMNDFLENIIPSDWKEMESQRDGTYSEAIARVGKTEYLVRLDSSGDGDAFNHLVVASVIF